MRQQIKHNYLQKLENFIYDEKHHRKFQRSQEVEIEPCENPVETEIEFPNAHVPFNRAEKYAETHGDNDKPHYAKII